MKKLSPEAYGEIRSWIYRNSRPLELALWQYLFENGKKEAVLSTLSFYQNPDGGFGNALEPDSWNPESSPYTSSFAIKILKRIGYIDIGHPIMQGLFRYLEGGSYFSDKGWLFSIPSNNEHAHAPWWTYSIEANNVESIGLTAELCSFVIRFFNEDSDLYKKVINIISDILERLKTQGKHGDMGIGGYCTLLETIDEVGLRERYDYDNLLSTLKRLASGSIERDMSKWAFYGVLPSNYVSSPESILYEGNEDIVQKELDYLIEKRPENSVWNITWSWFENNEKYQKEFAISENWWRAIKAIEKVSLLRNFARL